jgi:hypothetical protein
MIDDDPSAPRVPLQMLTSETLEYCDPQTGTCGVPAAAAEDAAEPSAHPLHDSAPLHRDGGPHIRRDSAVSWG